MTNYYIKTYGCQMNMADSERLSGLLDALGLAEVQDWREADVIILNTCSVRQAAEDKVFGWGKKLKIKNAVRGRPGTAKLKNKNNRPLVIMTGCMVGSALGERKRFDESYLRKRAGFVDHFLDIGEWEEQIPRILREQGLVVETRCGASLPRSTGGGIDPKRAPGEHAYVKISEGCDNFCSYCVVPFGRGKEVSRPREEILAEVKHLIGQGYTHVTLLGQNVNSWGSASVHQSVSTSVHRTQMRINSDIKMPFASLLREIHAIDGLEKISFLTANPFDFTQDLIDTLALPKIDRYLHMAVQSGSDRILERMNRKHTIAEYKELISRIRVAVPDISLGTDLIVGFPGETEDDFQMTLELVRDIGYGVVYMAMYSPRPGTLAAMQYEDDVPRSEKKRRHAVLTRTVENAKTCQTPQNVF